MRAHGIQLRIPALVRMAIDAQLLSGTPSLEIIAEELNSSPRTLQRQLSHEGLTFSGVVLEARTKLAQNLLTQSLLPISEVARRVGFTSSSSFCRAFHSWTGLSPGAYRRQQSVGRNGK